MILPCASKHASCGCRNFPSGHFPGSRRATLESERANASRPPQANVSLIPPHREITLCNLLVRVARKATRQLFDQKFSLDFEMRMLHVGQRCQGGDSNPYGLLHQILSLARLPISPPWQIATLAEGRFVDRLGQIALVSFIRFLRQIGRCQRKNPCDPFSCRL